jgi:hypothetical protein
MDDSSTGPVIIGLMFILRCLIPLGILFGISYLLQRLGLVTDHAEGEKTGPSEEEQKKGSPPKPTSGQHNKRGPVKSATPKKRSRKQ